MKEINNSVSDKTTCAILLVEDNAINQKVVKLMLGKFGLVPEIAECGEDAIKLTRTRSFDLILMDLHMPGMNGMQTSDRIHAELGEKCPPIVALTADAVARNEGNLEAHGIKGFLIKPVTRETLKECIQGFTGVKLD